MNVDCFSREVVRLVKAVWQFHFRCDAGKWDIWNSSLNPFAFFSLLTLYLLLVKCNAWFKHCCALPTYAQCQCLGFNWVRKSHLYYQQPFQNRTYKYQLVRENNFSLSLKQLFGVCFPVWYMRKNCFVDQVILVKEGMMQSTWNHPDVTNLFSWSWATHFAPPAPHCYLCFRCVSFVFISRYPSDLRLQLVQRPSG